MRRVDRVVPCLRGQVRHDIANIDVDDADQAVMLIRARAVRRVPVTDTGRLIGVVSMSDMATERENRSPLADINVSQRDR